MFGHERQTVKKTDRETDRQIERQTDRHESQKLYKAMQLLKN